MGSHGAANAAGQAKVLANYGIEESTMGCPVVSSFDVISLGRTLDGIETFAGKDAWESDGIFVINRVKWHTSFEGAIESGVSKMLALGVGKIEGARPVTAMPAGSEWKRSSGLLPATCSRREKFWVGWPSSKTLITIPRR